LVTSDFDIPGLGKPELVFSHGDGLPMDPDSVTKAFDRLVKSSGVRRITLKGLRHTHISHQLMDGVHVKIVSERAGHALVSVTLSAYATYIPNMQADAAVGIDTWLRAELTKEVGGKSVAIGGLGVDTPKLND
jgi:integrase